ncbi:MAG: chemotaxis protein CheR [Firmicutes bacterium]|nr:chemotaxis protein CheR [Bacillota bacterium]
MVKLKNDEFVELVEYLKSNYGINLTHKKNLIEGRLGNLLQERGFNTFAEYLVEVFADRSKQEMMTLINKLTTNHTFFMREASHFDYFRDRVLPYLVDTVTDKDLRIWSAGCSYGQEPYTLAMILADYFASEKTVWNSKILATDISVEALQKAEKGIYTAEDVQGIPPGWKLNYFSAVDKNFQVCSKIRNEVIYRVFNLIDEVLPFKRKFHIIMCRNVMIYFDEPTKNKLIDKFYEITEPGGYLFIGHAESINKLTSRYKFVMPAVYRKG